MGRQTDEKAAATSAAVRNFQHGKTALAHDWLTGFRGGEWILEAFCEMFPESPIYTLIHKSASTSPKIEAHEIHTSFLNSIPGIHQSYRKFLPLFPIAAEHLSIARDIETVVSSSHCVIKGVPTPPGAYHLCYVHSPMRYMYDQFDSYFGPVSGAPFYQQIGAKVFRPYLTTWDRASNKSVNMLVANSSFVRDRIRKFYERDAVVVHPFVETADFALAGAASTKDDFFLMVTAFAPNKRVDLAIAAFNELGLKLKIIGGGQDNARLRAMAGSTIEFLGSGIDRSGVISHMRKARAFIFPGVEDFGITPLEALAAETPVIAFRAGGVLETLTKADSVYFEEPRSASLIAAVREFETRERARDFKIDVGRLERFSRVRFKEQISDLLQARETL